MKSVKTEKQSSPDKRLGQAIASVIIGFVSPLVLTAGILTQSFLAIASGPISACGFALGILARKSWSVRVLANAGLFLNGTLLAFYVILVVMYFVISNSG